MILKKPLLFIYPLSPSLQKYLEFAKGSAEEEGFEIYELDILGEALQLVPTIGAALLLGSSPKKMAQILQTTRKVLQSKSSKVLLLTDKALPLKLVQKMQKIGLTEYLPEPVNPKTLIYKVGLLLKSLPIEDFNKKEKDESDVLINKSDIQQTEEKQRIEKGIISDTVIEEMQFDERPDIELTVESNKTEKNTLEDLLLSAPASEKKKKVNNLVEAKIDDVDDEKDDHSEESIDTYYKTINEDKIEIDIDQSEQEHKRTEEESENDDNSRISDGSFNIKLDSGNNESKKDDSLFNLAPRKVTKKDSESENNTSVVQEDDETELLLFEIEQAKKNIQNDALEESEKAKTIADKNDLFSVSENEKSNLKKGELLIEQTPSALTEEDAEDLDASYQLRSVKKTSTIDEQEKKKKEDSDLLLQTDEKVRSLIAEEDDQFNLEEMNLTSLELTKKASTNTEIQLKTSELSSEDASNLKLSAGKVNKNTQNELEIVSLESTEKNNSDKAESKDESITLSDSERLELNKGSEDGANSPDLLLEKKDSQRTKSSLLVENDQDEANSKMVAAAIDDIEVKDNQDEMHFDGAKVKKEKSLDLTLQSPTKNDQQKNQSEYEWSNINRQKKDVIDDRWVGRKKETIELVFEKEGRSGEEIDYRKLKKMFEHNDSIELSKKNKRDNSLGLSSQEVDDKTGKPLFKDIFQQFGENAEADSEQDIAQKTLFARETNGVDFLVRVLQLYFDKRSDVNIMLYISNALYRRYFAFGGFFIVKRDGTSDEFFSSAHQIEYNGDRQLLIKQWEELKKTNRDVWKSKTIPAWDDETFQSKGNNFTYPFFEGIDQLGFAHFVFPEGIGQKESAPLEMMIEAARAVYLERLRRNISTSEGEKVAELEKEKPGFFSNFFSKKKGN